MKGKGKGKDSAKAASPTGDSANANLRTRPLQPMKVPSLRAGMNGTRTVIILTVAGTTPHKQSCTQYSYAPKAKTRRKKKRRSKRSQGRGTDQTARNTTVSNSFESFTSHSLQPGIEPAETATAVFLGQHTVLLALTERINLDRTLPMSFLTQVVPGLWVPVMPLIASYRQWGTMLQARLSSLFHLRTRSSLSQTVKQLS